MSPPPRRPPRAGTRRSYTPQNKHISQLPSHSFPFTSLFLILSLPSPPSLPSFLLQLHFIPPPPQPPCPNRPPHGHRRRGRFQPTRRYVKQSFCLKHGRAVVEGRLAEGTEGEGKGGEFGCHNWGDRWVGEMGEGGCLAWGFGGSVQWCEERR